MPSSSYTRILLSTSCVALLSLSLPVHAASFNVTNGQTVSNQTLNSGETGTVDAGGTVNGFINMPSTSNVTVINNGTINTHISADYSVGAIFTNTSLINDYLLLDNASSYTLTNSGTMSDIYSSDIVGTDSVVTNSGTIASFTAFNSALTLNNTSTGTITNNVTLSSSTGINFTNDGAIGGYIFGSNSTNLSLTNNGTVGATIWGDGTTNLTITNNGTVHDIDATGSTNFTLILNSGSDVQGSVVFDGSTTGAVIRYIAGGMSAPPEGGGFVTGGGASTLPTITGGTVGVNYTLDAISGGGSAVLPAGAVTVTSGGQTLVVTPDEFAQSDQVVINQSLLQSGNLVAQRQQLVLLSKTTGVKTASHSRSVIDVEPAAGDDGVDGKVYWAEGFGAYKERPTDGQTAYSQARSGGTVMGVDLPETGNGSRIGFYAGGFAGQQDMGITSFRKIDSVGGLVGGYIGRTFGDGWYVGGQLAAGYADQDSRRRVGTNTAKASYNSYFISPSVTVMYPLETNIISGVTLVPSATLRYTGQFSDSYTEKGSTANQSVSFRDSHSVGGRVQMEAHFDQIRAGKGIFVPVLRAGVDGETDIGSNRVDLNVLGSNVSVDPSSNNPVDGIVGANLSYGLDNGPEIYVDGEASLGLNNGGIHDNKGATGRVGMRWQF